jgi:hypothetical protein
MDGIFISDGVVKIQDIVAVGSQIGGIRKRSGNNIHPESPRNRNKGDFKNGGGVPERSIDRDLDPARIRLPDFLTGKAPEGNPDVGPELFLVAEKEAGGDFGKWISSRRPGPVQGEIDLETIHGTGSIDEGGVVCDQVPRQIEEAEKDNERGDFENLQNHPFSNPEASR